MINEEEFRESFPNVSKEFADKYFKKNKNIEPSPFLKALKFGKAVLKHIANSFRNVDELTYNNRIKLCEECDKFIEEARKCSECGCYIDTKASWASEECPLKKWLKVDSKNKGCGCSSTK